MLQLLAGTDAGKGLVRFDRHRPAQTLLYKLVEQYYTANADRTSRVHDLGTAPEARLQY